MITKPFEQYPKAQEAYYHAEAHPEAQVDPTDDQLMDMWRDFYSDENSMKQVPGVLGVMRNTLNHHSTLVSVDLCEVVRESLSGVLSLGGFNLESMRGYYSVDKVFDVDEQQHPEAVTRLFQALMIEDKIEPVDNINDIRSILQHMRESGAYIVANTSTLPGCEPSTLRFMDAYLEHCFDGILFPRNHHGDGKLTKGVAMGSVVNELGTIVKTLHIDDAKHHVYATRITAGQLGTNHFDVTPIYPWNDDAQDLNLAATPLEAFQLLQEDISRGNN